MYLSRLTLARNRTAFLWISNPYRVHQRLCMACDGDPRLLFRIETDEDATRILVQSHQAPDWMTAFADLRVLARPPESKPFELQLQQGGLYQFRLLANPTVKRDGKRLGLMKEEEQKAWITRKINEAGMELLGFLIVPCGNQKSSKPTEDGIQIQVHFTILFNGVVRILNVHKAQEVVESGIGSAKGFGCGLLSLARAG
jgi:CRISPR system Cascade subunit CasE